MTDKTGGPAFPKTGNFGPNQPGAHDSVDQDGMTLRDYFAAKALAGICADPRSINMSPETVARASYDYADAMLAEGLK